MQKHLLQAAMEPDVLNHVWRLLKKEHTPWTHSVDRDQLQQNLILHLLKCREDVLASRYRPEPLRQYSMRKPNGKTRIISAQFLKDKFVQRALLTVIGPHAEAIFHHDSYAYRRGRSVDMAISKTLERIRIGMYWLVDADIKQFFDNIPITALKKQLKPLINDPPTMKLIDYWLKQGSQGSNLLKTSKGISQGAILSPLFCNLYMHQFDRAMEKANIPFVRFADDFLLFCKSKQDAEKSLNYACKTLNTLGLEIHPDKTRIVTASANVKFLGRSLKAPPNFVTC